MNYIFLMSIMDTISLFLWNFNSFITPITGVPVEFVSLASCKIMVFLQYVSLQASALLVSIICVDRLAHLLMTRHNHLMITHYLPFNTKKSARLWSLAILVLTCLINLHILIFNGNTGGCYSAIYDMTNVLNIIHLVVYTFIPLAVIFLADIFIILLFCKQKSQAQYTVSQAKQQPNPFTVTKSAQYVSRPSSFKEDLSSHNRSMTITVLFISISFVILTQPPSILFGFYENSPIHADPSNRFIFLAANFVMFLNHCIIFLKCVLFSSLFRYAISKAINRIYNIARCNFTVKEYGMNEI